MKLQIDAGPNVTNVCLLIEKAHHVTYIWWLCLEWLCSRVLNWSTTECDTHLWIFFYLLRTSPILCSRQKKKNNRTKQNKKCFTSRKFLTHSINSLLLNRTWQKQKNANSWHLLSSQNKILNGKVLLSCCYFWTCF